MVTHFSVRVVFHFLLVPIELHQQVVIALLLVLHVRLVIHTCSHLHHVLSYDGLHLQRIEELLVVEHVAHGLLVVLNLAELD